VEVESGAEAKGNQIKWSQCNGMVKKIKKQED